MTKFCVRPALHEKQDTLKCSVYNRLSLKVLKVLSIKQDALKKQYPVLLGYLLVLLFTTDRMKGWGKARERIESYMKLIFKDILFPLFIPVMLRFKLKYKLGEFNTKLV